ncbi:hypothetical protein BUALT_Bualt06G0083100 [Buddleja alternifolia]|uniref:TYRAAT2-like C-terminal domain-containing protein n=1 Tax=Buddleja alternifolia TaxID=168488 RepID=A0AAV6XLI2_9LAMI|nr:hypothetical protein BUALT_Bualt06G0083100 [Buddleja alternifolia]
MHINTLYHKSSTHCHSMLDTTTLFVDMLSVKEYPRDLMLQVLPQDSDVYAHIHFGPESGKDGWNDLTFMYEKVRITNEATCSSFLQIFATEEESTSRDSFDLFSGLFIHNRFAKEQLMNIELAVETITQQLVKRMNEEVDPSI